MGKERTSVVSTPSLAELYRFAMNFLLVRKRKKEEEQGRQEESEVEREGQSEETAHMDDYVDGCESARLTLEPNVSMDAMCKRG